MGRILFIDRSRVDTRQKCPRQRYYSYDYLSDAQIAALSDDTEVIGGISRIQGSLPLLNGIAIHAAHARLLAGWKVDDAVACVREEYSKEVLAKGVFNEIDVPALIKEQLSLLEGMLRLWAMWRLPAILAEYDLATFDNKPAIELAWEWQMAPGLVQRLRMDAILRRRHDGLLHILDYKSAKSIDNSWRNKFEHDLQTELYVQALKEKTGEPVGGMLYEGMVKGAYRKDGAKSSAFYGQRIQASPYCYAYLLEGEAGNVWSAEYTAKKGFRKVRITDIMPTKEWVETQLQYLVQPADLFVSAAPICPPPFELERIKRQVVSQELWYHQQLDEYRRLLAEGKDEEAEDLLDLFAPQTGSFCYKYVSKDDDSNRCAFVDGVCWTRGARPLDDGGFEIRHPHHEPLESA